MRIVHPVLTTPIVFQENIHPVLVVEQPKLYRNMVSDLLMQTQGEEGEFVLSKDFVPVEGKKHLHVILDYFHLSANEKRLQTPFMATIKQIVNHDLTTETTQVMEALHQYLSAILRESPYPVDMAEDVDPMAILKAVGLQLHLDTDSLLGRLISYLSLCNDLLPTPCFVLVGAATYFDREELGQLQEMAGYQKWNMLRLEPYQLPRLPNECHRIIDADLCEICVDLEG